MDETGHSRLAWEKLGAGWLEQRAANPEERTRGLSDYCITPCDKRTVRIRTLPLSWFPGTTTAGDRHLRWLRLGLAAKYGCAGMYSGTYDFSAARACPFVVPKDGDVVPAPDGQGTPGIYVFSGPLPLPANMAASELDDEERVPAVGNKKKREYVFLEHAAAESVRIPQHVFDAFELINSTPSGRGLEPTGSWRELKPTLTAGHRIPVFILGDLKSQQFDFGLTRSFKVAHARSVGGVLDVQTRRAHRLRADMVPDWAEALFGSVVEEDDLLEPGQPRPRRLPGEAQPPSKLARKGRVAVGFARATTPATLFPAPPTPAISTTMMGPRASFAPHYLVGAIKHWSDTGAGLAGRKRYFPRFAGGDTAAAREMVMADRTLPPQRGDGTVSRLRFLVPASGQAEIGFTGSIRVHNLLAEELGALLWVLTHGGDVGGPTRHMIGRAKAFGAGQTRVAAVRLNLHGHDDAADKQLGGAAPLQTFLAAFEAAMDQAVRAAGLRGRWAEQAQVGEWLGLSDPTWGKEERQRVRAHYPGAVAATRNGQPGMDMSQGPREHMKLRREVGNRNIGALRWLATPRRVPKPR